MIVAKLIERFSNKYFQSFTGHNQDCLILLREYLEIHSEVINSFCNYWQINSEKFKKNLFLTTALHDIGKLTKEFQENIKAGKKSTKYPHPFFAMPVLSNLEWDQIMDFPIELCAILGHHTQLYGQIYLTSKIAKEAHFLEDDMRHYFTRINQLYQDLGFNEFFELPEVHINEIEKYNRDRIYDRFIRPLVTCYYNKKDRFRIKSVFSFFFSILQTCDDYSSAHFKKYIEENQPEQTVFDSVLSHPEKYVFAINYTNDELKEILLGQYDLYDFQRELIERKPYFGFLFAPCGRGKTEASLLWAREVMEHYHKNKIIFALPTQTTCNAMFNRLCDQRIFGEKNVGLFHGKSFITIKNRQNEVVFTESEDDVLDEKTYDAVKDETFKGNVYFKPITVTTIDHLAYSFIHGFSQSDFACGNLQNAVIIFDEIHYYEKHTLQVLLSLFAILRKLNIPHLLMTGTAPEFILKEIERDYSLIKDNQGLEYEPFYLETRTDNLIEDNRISDEVLEEIIKDYEKHNKIFIIANTVNKAQTIYRQLKTEFGVRGIEARMILYHSRFTYKHRVAKEEEIYSLVEKAPCIIVATQVIEISLDISCDIMYSEISPADALGQRGGRLHRSGTVWKDDKEYLLKVFAVESERPYRSQLIENAQAAISDGPISYQKIKEFCDEVYKDFEIEPDQKYKQCFKNNIVFGDHYQDICWGEDEGKACKIRDDKFTTIEVIPSRLLDECLQGIKQGDFLTEYKVRIPYFYVAKDIREYGDLKNFHPQLIGREKVLICDYDYTYEMGMDFENAYCETQII